MIEFLTLNQVIEIHDDFIQYGGLPGIRDIGLLESAIEMPKAMMFGKFLHETIYDKGAAYLFHIVQNHPFNDGNKRTGALSTLLFLDSNGVQLHFSDEEYEEFIILVASGKKNKHEISEFLAQKVIAFSSMNPS